MAWFKKGMIKAVCVAVVIMMVMSGCGQPQIKEKQNYAFGILVSLKLYDTVDDTVYQKVFDHFKEIDSKMSPTIKGSDVFNVNAQAGGVPVGVSNETLTVVEKALEYSLETQGKFDTTVYPIVKLWGIGTENQRVPSEQEIQQALPFVGWQQVEVEGSSRTVHLPQSGMGIDLGAIAKGYAADEAAKILKDNGVDSGIINIGGNILALGHKRDGSPWQVGVQDPLSSRGEYLGIVPVENKTLVTSGIYERYFEQDGKRYHHILDPATGYPVDNTLAGVTVLTEKSIDADALSTSCFALGLKEGMAFAQSKGAEVLYVTKDKKIYMTSGFKRVFKLTNTTYTIVEE